MNAFELGTLAGIFAVVSVAAYALMTTLVPRETQKRLRELQHSGEGEKRVGTESAWKQRFIDLLEPWGRAALPEEGWEKSALRIRFMHAGFRGKGAPAVFFGAKTLLAVVFPLIFLMMHGVGKVSLGLNSALVLMLLFSTIGYYLPNIVLGQIIKHRQRELFEAFPDAIDLMTVSVEAGLGLDAAIGRVGAEMHLESPVLAEEFHLMTLELRAGSSREHAFRNLALRTGLDDVDALVAMLIQADRFGTSIAASLRVHSDALRTKRRLRAEEAAAKIPVKILFPVIFFIFPSLMLVLLGPAAISVFRILVPTMAGN